ncbi:MAG: dihydrofolate reductase family protein [Gemmatimonadaceae bacterium]
MRKVILQEWVTIDGFAAGPNGELDFFASSVLNEGSDRDLLRFIDTVDTILLGAVTYRLFVDFWPTATTDDEIIADKLNATPKIVFSQTLDRAPWGKWGEAKVVKTSAAEEINELKRRPGKDMVLWGSISLAQSLMKEGLIDECHLRVCPVALGKGRRLFPDDVSTIDMKLLETRAYESGLVLLRYGRPSLA